LVSNMSLINRLSGTQKPKLPVHQFWGAFVEYSLGQKTAQQVADAFGLVDQEDVDEFNWLVSKYDTSSNKERFLNLLHSLFCLAERNIFNYADKATMQARITAIG